MLVRSFKIGSMIAEAHPRVFEQTETRHLIGQGRTNAIIPKWIRYDAYDGYPLVCQKWTQQISGLGLERAAADHL
jgi:hypothetical protein